MRRFSNRSSSAVLPIRPEPRLSAGLALEWASAGGHWGRAKNPHARTGARSPAASIPAARPGWRSSLHRCRAGRRRHRVRMVAGCRAMNPFGGRPLVAARRCPPQSVAARRNRRHLSPAAHHHHHRQRAPPRARSQCFCRRFAGGVQRTPPRHLLPALQPSTPCKHHHSAHRVKIQGLHT